MKLGTKPKTMHELKQKTDAELFKYLKSLAKEANTRLKEVKKTGFMEYSNVYARKYMPMIKGQTIPGLVNTRHMFSATKGTKANMMERIYQLERYLLSDYTTAEHVKQYVQNSMDIWGLESESDLKTLFDAYRDFGGDDYHDTSDHIIQAFADIIHGGFNIKRALQYIKEINESMDIRTISSDTSNVMTYRDYLLTANEVGQKRTPYAYARKKTKESAKDLAEEMKNGNITKKR